MTSSSKRVGKFLSLVLRHDPARIGLTLDARGWATVDDLLSRLADAGESLTRERLEEIVAADDKQRFSFSEGGTRLRANQGHSVEVDLELVPRVPPDRLFHGTTARFTPSIRKHGLLRGERHHVHLSLDEATATTVGGRRGVPVVLVVDAAAMVAAGHVFFLTENGVWLTEHVPREFLSWPCSES
ncbi:MAG: RNA 2'-phosphotransferase [Acidobacteriota bacterium]